MINTLNVREGQVQEFLTRWSTTSFYADQWLYPDAPASHCGCRKSYVQFQQHRDLGFSKAFLHAYEEYVPSEEYIPEIEFHPAIYEEIVMSTNLSPKSSSGKE